jgi:protein-disulfide isomerase
MTNIKTDTEPNPVPTRVWRLWHAGRALLEVISTLAVILVCSTLLWQRLGPQGTTAAKATSAPSARRPSAPLPVAPLSTKDTATLGNLKARVAMVMFSDFQCPFCQRFALDVLPTLNREYVTPGRVLLVFRSLPLEEIHMHALQAAESGECARRQGRFWQMHDRLFQNPKDLDESSLRQQANVIGLDARTFDSCLAGEATTKVRADEAEAHRLGITGTPAFFVGKILADSSIKAVRLLSGARPVAEFRAALDEALVQK